MIKVNVFTKVLSFILFTGLGISFAVAQTTAGNLSLEECYSLARSNYPLIKQQDLISRTNEFSLDNAQKAVMPQLSIAGQATHQSDVTSMPIKLPNMEIPTISKSQYKVYAELTQSLTGLVNLKDQKESLNVNTAVENQKVEVEMYKLKERINNLYFAILLLEKQKEQIELSIQDLQSGIEKMETAVANGVALRSSASNLKAEKLKADQRITELEFNKKAYLEVLGVMIGQRLNPETKLQTPAPLQVNNEIHRPEQTLFSLQRKSLNVQNKLIDNKSLPQFSLFVQGGVGQPALNMLNPETQGFYIAGLRLAWNLNSFYTQKNEKNIIRNNQRILDVQEETFLFNTKMNLNQQQTELSKYQELLKTDQEIIDLHEQVKNSTLNQLNYGTATSNDYLISVNVVEQAKQNLALHEVQLLMAQYNLQTTTGKAEN